MENIANFIKQCLDAVLNIFNFLNPLSEDFILKDILTFLGNILSYINPFSNNFILKDVISFLIELLSYINPFSENFILIDVLEFLFNILSYINPFSENFFGYKIIDLFSDLLEYLFVPKEDHLTELKAIVDSKFGFIGQVKELVNNLFAFPSTVDEEVPPSFEITYMGMTLTIIDFSVLEYFRSIFHMIVCAVLWISFIFRLYKRLPGIIGSYDVTDSLNLTGGGNG